jgi:hypothetical protein
LNCASVAGFRYADGPTEDRDRHVARYGAQEDERDDGYQHHDCCLRDSPDEKTDQNLSSERTRLTHLTKYHFSGLMFSVVDCGITPRREFVISVSWYTPFGCQTNGSWVAR